MVSTRVYIYREREKQRNREKQRKRLSWPWQASFFKEQNFRSLRDELNFLWSVVLTTRSDIDYKVHILLDKLSHILKRIFWTPGNLQWNKILLHHSCKTRDIAITIHQCARPYNNPRDTRYSLLKNISNVFDISGSNPLCDGSSSVMTSLGKSVILEVNASWVALTLNDKN